MCIPDTAQECKPSVNTLTSRKTADIYPDFKQTRRPRKQNVWPHWSQKHLGRINTWCVATACARTQTHSQTKTRWRIVQRLEKKTGRIWGLGRARWDFNLTVWLERTYGGLVLWAFMACLSSPCDGDFAAAEGSMRLQTVTHQWSYFSHSQFPYWYWRNIWMVLLCKRFIVDLFSPATALQLIPSLTTHVLYYLKEVLHGPLKAALQQGGKW